MQRTTRPGLGEFCLLSSVRGTAVLQTSYIYVQNICTTGTVKTILGALSTVYEVCHLHRTVANLSCFQHRIVCAYNKMFNSLPCRLTRLMNENAQLRVE